MYVLRMIWKWDSAWPVEVTPSNLVSTAVADSSANSSFTANKLQGSSTSLAVQNIFTSFESDATFYNALHGKTYLAAGMSIYPPSFFF